jgi:hypothetical protein
MSRAVTMNLKAEDYTSRVLGVIKEKYGLNDKSQALNKFVDMFGEEFVEKEVSEDYIKKILAIEDRHFKKYGYRNTTFEQLEKELEGD